MKQSVIIESDCVVNNLDFPRYLDHAWLLVAEGIHARLYKRTVGGEYVPHVAAGFYQIEKRKYVLSVSDRHTWSDGNKILAAEVAKALGRGRCIGVFSSIRTIGSHQVEVVMSRETALDAELLASPLFTLTPSCRDITTNKKVTCGPYVLTTCTKDNRVMKFKNRLDCLSSDGGPAEITVVVTETRGQGIRFLQSGNINLTCPLGANPESFARICNENTVSNVATNLGVILKPYPGSALAQDGMALSLISKAIDRVRLSANTKNTFLPMFSVSQLFQYRNEIKEQNNGVGWCARKNYLKQIIASDWHRHPLELRYTEFEPNRLVANEIKMQLYEFLNIRCSLLAVPYSEYITGRLPRKNGFSLEIIQPIAPETVTRARSVFIDVVADSHLSSSSAACACMGLELGINQPVAIPLLQAVTSLVSFDPDYRGRFLINSEAILDWSKL